MHVVALGAFSLEYSVVWTGIWAVASLEGPSGLSCSGGQYAQQDVALAQYPGCEPVTMWPFQISLQTT